MLDPTYIFSNGAGKDSIAVMVLQSRGITPPFIHIFANVGAKAENPKTLEYIETHLKPFAQKHGITFVETCKRNAEGTPVDLWDYTLNPNTKSIPIPFYRKGKAPVNRTCTTDFKVRIVNAWIKNNGYKNVRLGIGFNADEAYRAGRKPKEAHTHEMTRDEKTGDFRRGRKLGFTQTYTFPLLLHNINRNKVEQLILSEGLPLPPKSACIFCPFVSRGERIEQKRIDQDIFESALLFEHELNKKYKRIKGTEETIYIHPDKIPLISTPDQMSLWDKWNDTERETCNSGYCGL